MHFRPSNIRSVTPYHNVVTDMFKNFFAYNKDKIVVEDNYILVKYILDYLMGYNFLHTVDHMLIPVHVETIDIRYWLWY